METLCQIIRDEAVVKGVLPFSRFMELALYCPVYGYYETQKDNVGRRGDFYTSVGTGELFGQLLAFQFAGWLEAIGSLQPRPAKLHLIEAGAHDGKLAVDILGWLQSKCADMFTRFQYGIIEPSSRRQEWQREALQAFSPHVQWFDGFEDLKRKTGGKTVKGILFSNELLDAMPVRRFGWDAMEKIWFEWGVAVAGRKFVWVKISQPDLSPSAQIFNLPSSLLAVLPDGYTVETSPAAQNWWREAAGILGKGKLLAIDYGLTADELFLPSRVHGTLRAYFQHHVTDDILANVGLQDITAHVNFSAIQAVGEPAGLTTECLQTQPKFLTGILGAALKDQRFGDWNASRTRQFQTLTHPEHLGRAFRVLVQSK